MVNKVLPLNLKPFYVASYAAASTAKHCYGASTAFHSLLQFSFLYLTMVFFLQPLYLTTLFYLQSLNHHKFSFLHCLCYHESKVNLIFSFLVYKFQLKCHRFPFLLPPSIPLSHFSFSFFFKFIFALIIFFHTYHPSPQFNNHFPSYNT